MATNENVQAWSTSHASNSNADAGINWAENQDSASVNDSARAMMAAIAKWLDDTGGAVIATGTANGLLATTQQVLSAAHFANGLRIGVRAISANTSATVTLSVDGSTAYNIRRADGSALVAGDIQANMFLDLVFNATAGGWRAINISPGGSLAGAGRASFSAVKGGSQTVATTSSTLIAIGTENFDVGGNYASNIWIPPAGTVSVTAKVALTNNSGSSGQFFLHIAKNAVAFASVYSAPLTPTGAGITLLSSIIDQTDGTAQYSVRTASTVQPYDIEINGTVFFGYMI